MLFYMEVLLLGIWISYCLYVRRKCLFGEGNGNPLQYACLGNPMDRGAWRAIVHGVTKSQTRLSNQTTKYVRKLLIFMYYLHGKVV